MVPNSLHFMSIKLKMLKSAKLVKESRNAAAEMAEGNLECADSVNEAFADVLKALQRLDAALHTAVDQSGR